MSLKANHRPNPVLPEPVRQSPLSPSTRSLFRVVRSSPVARRPPNFGFAESPKAPNSPSTQGLCQTGKCPCPTLLGNRPHKGAHPAKPSPRALSLRQNHRPNPVLPEPVRRSPLIPSTRSLFRARQPTDQTLTPNLEFAESPKTPNSPLTQGLRLIGRVLPSIPPWKKAFRLPNPRPVL